jgi:hypothetical protein
VFAKSFTSMYIGKMNLNKRNFHPTQGIAQRYAGMYVYTLPDLSI